MNMERLETYTRTAELLARQAGCILEQHIQAGFVIEYKAQAELVTAADRASEQFLAGQLRQSFPDHAVMGEESGWHGAEAAAWVWVIDPLDGTQSFTAGLPLFGVSIALLHAGQPVVGVIYLPSQGWMYTGWSGQPTRKDGRVIQARRAPLDGNAIIGIQSSFHEGDYPAYVGRLHRKYSTRVLGSAAAHLAFVAEGCFAAATDLRCRLWDIAAGACLLSGAGAQIVSPEGEPLFPLRQPVPAYRDQRIPWFATGNAYGEALRQEMFTAE